MARVCVILLSLFILTSCAQYKFTRDWAAETAGAASFQILQDSHNYLCKWARVKDIMKLYLTAKKRMEWQALCATVDIPVLPPSGDQ